MCGADLREEPRVSARLALVSYVAFHSYNHYVLGSRTVMTEAGEPRKFA